MNVVAAEPNTVPAAKRADAVGTDRKRLAVRCNDLTVLASCEGLLRRNELDSLDALFAAQGDSLSKPGLAGWRERIRLTADGESEPVTLYLKRFRSPPSSVRRAVAQSETGARSVASFEWKRARELATAGVACATPIAFGEELDGDREVRSAVLLAEVPGISLETWITSPDACDEAELRRISRQLAAVIARLHAAGFVHRDLYLCHVFCDFDAQENPLHLIDLQRVMRPLRRTRRWIVKDLAALNVSAPTTVVSATQRVRWLRDYLGLSKLDGSAKCLAYRVVGKTMSIARHEHRRQRRLRTIPLITEGARA